MDEQVKLRSKEDIEHKLSRKSAEVSILIKNTLQDASIDDPIPLLEVDDKILVKIIEYLEHFNGTPPAEIEKPLKSPILKEVTDEWSASFIDSLTLEILVDLTVAANYMEIQALLDLCCAKIASMCKDKSEEEIFKTFGITETFTEEEKAKIREENKWIEENL
jgi:S-phase kinase-associated protein 1